MHPAPSIILFTVLSGLGLGLIATIGFGFGGQGHLFGWIAGPVGLAITAAGGLASLGHLGRPDRAWRALSQWRSSWLSREGVLMLGTMTLFSVYLGLWLLFGLRISLLGWIAGGLAAVTVYATAMIYAQLRTVPRWSGTPTPWMFLGMAATGGLIANGAIAGLVGSDGPGWRAILMLIVGAAVAIWWQTQAAGARRGLYGSSMETATGLSALGRVRLLEPPHTGSNYLLKEMAFEVGRKRAYQLRLIGAVLGFLAPIFLALIALIVGGWLLILALISHIAGMLALRWLFFAEAEHVQALYYGHR